MSKLRLFSFILLGIIIAALVSISVGVHFGESAEAYSSPVMIILWGAEAISALVVIVRERKVAFGIHMALIIILAGALTTHLSSEETELKIRNGSQETGVLPFAVKVKEVNIMTYPGTDAPMDFSAGIMVENKDMVVAMNKVASCRGYRFFIKSVNPEEDTVTLWVQKDGAGILITYSGYILLALGMILFFFNKNSSWRASLRRVVACLMLLACFSPEMNASTGKADFSRWFQRLSVYHNDRVAPLPSFSADLVRQVSGSERNADEIVFGLLFNFSEWKDRKIILVKSGDMRRRVGLKGKYASYTDYVDAIAGGKIDDSRLQEYSRKEQEDFARFEALNMLVNGSLLRVYPVKEGAKTVWLSPADKPPLETDSATWTFIRKSMGYMNELVKTSRYGDSADVVDKIVSYQERVVGKVNLPGSGKMAVEVFYIRHLRPALLPAIAGVCLGLLLLILATSGSESKRRRRVMKIMICMVGAIMTLYTGVCLGIRWYISGHVPLSDGFETMQFMALLASLSAVVSSISGKWICRVAASGGILIAGLCLLVSSMNGGGATVTPLMPVLSSVWLSIHVVLMMLAYTMFALMAVGGVCALCSSGDRPARLGDFCRVLLVPAVFILAAGIFTGAVWANQSWGRYWGWDPKEVWALITLLVYVFPIHGRVLRVFKSQRAVAIYCIVAFCSVLFTYFGVNYLLGGLHSYA